MKTPEKRFHRRDAEFAEKNLRRKALRGTKNLSASSAHLLLGFSSKLLVACALVLVTVVFGSCTTGPLEPQTQRITLGEMQVALIASRPNTVDVQFRGRVTAFDTRDSLYTAPGIGTFKHFVALRDTLTGDTLRVYYTLPLGQVFKVDTSSRVVLLYKKIHSRFALILKSKNDSLIAMVNTLLPDEPGAIEAQTGAQRLRVAVGNELYASRNTGCGREGDYNLIFSTPGDAANVAPARAGHVRSGEKVYAAINVTNTRVIKNLDTCPNFEPTIAYMIIKQ